MLHEDATVHADRHSLAAGRDINLTISADELQFRLARYADDPRAMHCYWCGLRGQPPSTDHCLICGYDIGVERRAREAAAARRTRWLSRVGDLRFLASFALALMLVGLLFGRYPQLFGTARDTSIGGLMLLVMLCALIDYGLIGVTVWAQYDVPRWLAKHRFGWLLNDGR